MLLKLKVPNHHHRTYCILIGVGILFDIVQSGKISCSSVTSNYYLKKLWSSRAHVVVFLILFSFLFNARMEAYEGNAK